jgi:hypothetical protein
MSSMPGDVYGGGAWMQQFADLLAQAAAQGINLADLLGWYNEGYEAPREAPTEQQALEAIWANRPDIQAAYADWWRDREYTPAEAVRNWLSISPEANGQSAVDFALGQGWVQPATEGSEGTERPTLAREQWEDQVRQSDRAFEEDQRRYDQEFLRQQGLDDEAIRQWQAEHDYMLAQSAEDARRYDAEFARQAGLDAEAIRQWESDKAERESQYAEDRRRYDAEFARQAGLDAEEVRRWDAEFTRQQAQDTEDTRRWESEFGLQREQYQTEADLARQGLGLDYIKLLGSLKGPRDWVQYANVQRAAEGTALPAWAQMLMQGQSFAPYQGAGQAQAATPQGMLQPAQTDWASQLMAQAQQPTAYAPQAMGFLQNPQQVRIDQWNNMLPSEQQMLAGAVDSSGGYFDDWYTKMMKAAPTGGKAQGTSWFSGW